MRAGVSGWEPKGRRPPSRCPRGSRVRCSFNPGQDRLRCPTRSPGACETTYVPHSTSRTDPHRSDHTSPFGERRYRPGSLSCTPRAAGLDHQPCGDGPTREPGGRCRFGLEVSGWEPKGRRLPCLDARVVLSCATRGRCLAAPGRPLAGPPWPVAFFGTVQEFRILQVGFAHSPRGICSMRTLLNCL